MHINSNDLNNFQNEEMNTDEIIAFLEHMNHCNYCLNQLVDEYTDHASSAPAYLKGTIMERVQPWANGLRLASASAVHSQII